MNGNKHETEDADFQVLDHLYCIRTIYLAWYLDMVGERSSQRRSGTETSRGAAASDYAGMSNDKTGENPVRRKPKVSWGR